MRRDVDEDEINRNHVLPSFLFCFPFRVKIPHSPIVASEFNDVEPVKGCKRNQAETVDGKQYIQSETWRIWRNGRQSSELCSVEQFAGRQRGRVF